MSNLFFTTPEPPDLSRARFAQVAIERGIEQAGRGRGRAPRRAGAEEIDGALTYRADDPAIAPGDRVRAPLGRGDQLVEGIVIRVGGAELLGDLPADKVKAIAGRTGAGLSPGLLELGRWISQYYICPLGMTLATMMPAAVKRGTGARQVAYVDLAAGGEGSPADQGRQGEPDGPKLSPAVRKAWELVGTLDRSAFPLTHKELAGVLAEAGGKVSLPTLKKLVALGRLTETLREEIHARGDGDLSGLGSADPSDAAAGRDSTPGARPPPLPPTPTGEQQRVIDGLIAALGRFSAHLIRGVTGSGKTEVYLRAIEACVRRGASAIVLVPEIALTPQTSGRFIERFARVLPSAANVANPSLPIPGFGRTGAVAVLHSGLTAAQRHAQWAACASGRVQVVVGARSAVFAPLPRIGLIVVDEEHDSSYKQDQLPRYHARDVAVKRAQLLGCPVVLGSATPSLESFANALPVEPGGGGEGGRGGDAAAAASGIAGSSASKYTLWTLPSRVSGALPRVEIVDLLGERRARAAQDGWRDRHLHLLGPTLERALERTLQAGGQAMLLLNKRGYANYICCPDPKCGWVMHCGSCDVTMVLHLHERLEAGGGGGGGGIGAGRAGGGYVRCHHCDSEQLLPAKCPVCARKVNTFGLGTQRVEEELERKFGVTLGLRGGEGGAMQRVDSDTMGDARDYFAVLDRFARGEVRVLLGTQMIAKGLDFPNVRLVGVINADTSLNLPDFRAAERTFQLVSQVAGRAGRGREPGLVIVQTASPQEASITLAARHDYEAFARAELATRARAGLPPAGRMARIVCRDEDHAKAAAHAAEVHAALRAAIDALGERAGRVRLRPPAPCPIARIADHHRIGIELMAQTRGVIQAVLGDVRSRGLLKSDARTAVDVDPVALL